MSLINDVITLLPISGANTDPAHSTSTIRGPAYEVFKMLLLIQIVNRNTTVCKNTASLRRLAKLSSQSKALYIG